MSAILENLRMDHKCLLRMMDQAGFAGDETGIRVRDPQMLSDALASGIKEIERLQLALDQWRQEVGKKSSQIDRLRDENKGLREALADWLRALQLIEASTAAYYGYRQDAHRHEHRAVQELRAIADALGFDLVKREPVIAPVKQAAE